MSLSPRNDHESDYRDYETNDQEKDYSHRHDRSYRSRSRSPSRSRSRSPVRRSRTRSRSRSRERHRERARRINLISKRCIISNVPYEMKWQDIKDLFRKEVGEVSYVEMWETSDGKSRGSGIIEFKDKDTARKAIEKMHRYKLKDRNIVVREERESDQRQISAMSNRGMMGNAPGGGMGGSGMMGNMGGGMMGNMGGSGGNMGISPQILQQLGIEGPVTNTVFVSNLDYKVQWKKLKDVFKLAGNVTRAEVKTDKDGKSRGMGTVTFEHPMEAVQAISMFNNQTLYDRPMRVKMDSLGAGGGAPEKQMNLPSGLKGIGMGLGAGGAPLSNISQMSGDYGTGSGGMGMGMGGGMGGMSGMSGMGGMSGMDNSMGMGTGMGTGMGSGMGMGSMGAGMGTNMAAGRVMGMGGNMGASGLGTTGMGVSSMGTGMGTTGTMGLGGMGGGMNDSFGSSMVSSGMGSTGFGSTGMGGGGMADSLRGMGNSSLIGSSYSSMDSMGLTGSGGGSSSGYGSSYSSQERSSSRSERSTRPDNCTIICKNLPYALNWQGLKEKFKAIADVKYAEIKTENGKSMGWGLVRFGTPDDAQRAISLMNRCRIDGREIDVKLYK